MNYHGPYRKSLRLGGYDYSQNGTYFVTICTADRLDFFGTIENGIVCLNETGELAAKFWSEIPQHFANVKLDQWIIMPNHLHGILIIDNGRGGGDISAAVSVGDANLRPLPKNQQQPPPDRSKMLLPKIIQTFKAAVTRHVHQINPHSPFGWQRSYYDHIIRNEESLNNIREYIQNNPIKWAEDVESTNCIFSDLDIKNHYDRLFFDHH